MIAADFVNPTVRKIRIRVWFVASIGNWSIGIIRNKTERQEAPDER